VGSAVAGDPRSPDRGRLLVALDDSVNPWTGRKVFACQSTFDHAAKTNQSPFVWAQTIVTVGLLKAIHGRWSCVPLAFAFYLRRPTLSVRHAKGPGSIMKPEICLTSRTRWTRVASVSAGAVYVLGAHHWLYPFHRSALYRLLRSRAFGK
jgi:hypothetical protein